MAKSFFDFKSDIFETLTEATALERRAEREQSQADAAKAAAAADTRRRRAREARQNYHRDRKRALELGEAFKPGDTVHLGHATKGGTGVIGKVVKVEGGKVHIKNERGDTFRGPVSRATLKNESVGLGEATRTAFKGADRATADFQRKLKELGMAQEYMKMVRLLKKKGSGFGLFMKEEDRGEEYASKTGLGPSLGFSIAKVNGEKLGVEDVQKRGDTTYKKTLVAMNESVELEEASIKVGDIDPTGYYGIYTHSYRNINVITGPYSSEKQAWRDHGGDVDNILTGAEIIKKLKKGEYKNFTLKVRGRLRDHVELDEANMPKFDEVLRKGKKLGDWNMMSYFLYNGNVWMLKSGRAVNQGPLETFMKRSQSGLINSLKFESVQEELGLPSHHPDHHVYKSTEHNLKNGGNPTTRKRVQQYATRNRINMSSDEAKAINAKGKHGDAFKEQQRRVQQHLKDRHTTKKESVELDELKMPKRDASGRIKSDKVRAAYRKGAEKAFTKGMAHDKTANAKLSRGGAALNQAITNMDRKGVDAASSDIKSAEKHHAKSARAFNRMNKRDKKSNESVELDEVSPPGFEGTVKAMKKYKDIDNPYALAWYMKNKGYKSHKTKEGKDKK